MRLDADYTRRSRSLDTLKGWDLDHLGPVDDRDAALALFPNNNYFGGVFLTHDHAANLRMLVNREGFIPEGGYDALTVLVRTGLDLCTRVHAAASYEKRKARGEARKQAHYSGGGDQSPTRSTSLKASLEGAIEALAAARGHILGTRDSDSFWGGRGASRKTWSRHC